MPLRHEEAYLRLRVGTPHQVRLSNFGAAYGTRFCGSDGVPESNATCTFTVLDLQDVRTYDVLLTSRQIELKGAE